MIALHDQDVIYGIGTDATSAREDALLSAPRLNLKSPGLRYSQITNELVALVREHGGSIRFQQAARDLIDIVED